MLPFGQLKVTTWETDLTFFSQEDQDGHYQHHREMVITMVTNNNVRSSTTNQVGSGVRIGRRGEKLNLTESSSILKVVFFDLMSDGG